jgi:hypothetical protein
MYEIRETSVVHAELALLPVLLMLLESVVLTTTVFVWIQL